MRILIVAPSKSGSSAVFDAIKQSLPAEHRGAYIFERGNVPAEGPVLFKFIIGYSDEVLPDYKPSTFDKKLYLVRDPRDMMVSRLLYTPYNCAVTSDMPAFFNRLLAKEQDPAAVSMLDLFEPLRWENDAPVLDWAMNMMYKWLTYDQSGHFRVRYEDFVAGFNLGLEKYLGFPLRFNGYVDGSWQRVERRIIPGDWRNWFTPKDVEFFSRQPEFTVPLADFGYDTNWHTAAEPRIPPKHSSEYVKGILAERGFRLMMEWNGG